MPVTSRQLSARYKKSHEQMRDIDGLQPQEAFDELLKYLFLKESADGTGYRFPKFSPPILNQELVSINQNLVKSLRWQLEKFLKETNSWASELWQDKSLRLSDAALLGVHELFEKVDFSTIDIDTRSVALSEFIPGELRKGLGIFPTPDSVARMMVEIASPNSALRVYDPACGTGTFLIEVVRWWRNSCPRKKWRLWGADKSARMLLLSELNLGHNKNVDYRRALADSLYQDPSILFKEVDEGFDFILTNPPFGVAVDRNKHDMTPFQTCRNESGGIVKRQQSEVVFIEQCLKYLKPGGLLGVVLPKSVVTNSSLRTARVALNSLGYLETIVNLPPETFSVSGTQTNTVVLFIRRYKTSSEKAESVAVVCIDVDNVGFDSTGRVRSGNQLDEVPGNLRRAMKGELAGKGGRLFPKIAKQLSITSLPELLSGRMTASIGQNMAPLSEFVELACNGRTPSRANYSPQGLFLVKVGNLTGQGINWDARDRNYIFGIEANKRQQDARLILKKGDILLTSSAHSPVYIAKKIDVVGAIPEWIGGKASYVGEVMMLRPKKGVDSYLLVAYLRLPAIQKQMRSMTRGQTAHLHSKDLLEMKLPQILANSPPLELVQLAEKIKREALLFEELNELMFEQRKSSAVIENMLLY